MANKMYAAALLIVFGLAAVAQAQTFTTLYNFTFGSDGAIPDAGLIQDDSGNLYGTAEYGGDLNCFPPSGCGVVYKLDTAGRQTVLYAFGSRANGVDGSNPIAPVARDKAGNLYGTTYGGSGLGLGTVFKVDTAGKETLLYPFGFGSGGRFPYQGLLVGKSGTLFGTTSDCGCSNPGTIYKIDSAGKFTLLHSFSGGKSDGGLPLYGHLTMDKSGNLYGVASEGGVKGQGVLYELGKSKTFKVLHSFAGGARDGCAPTGTVLRDKAGNFYGTTAGCGSSGNGTIWKVSPKGKETILHHFAGGTEGCDPEAGVTRDAKGNLYGVTYGCGTYGFGALYKLSASGSFTLLHSFNGADGDAPQGEVLRTSQGTLYGTTVGGGTYDWGTVWSYVP